jgi:hypothetical protein
MVPTGHEMGGLQTRSGSCGEQKYPSLPGIEPRLYSHYPGHNTEESRLLTRIYTVQNSIARSKMKWQKDHIETPFTTITGKGKNLGVRSVKPGTK